MNREIQVPANHVGTTPKQKFLSNNELESLISNVKKRIHSPNIEERIIASLCPISESVPSEHRGEKRPMTVNEQYFLVHPQWNYHAFQEVSLLSRIVKSLISWKPCFICNAKLSGVILHCVSCSIYIHRSCGFIPRPRTIESKKSNNHEKICYCSVNFPLVKNSTGDLSGLLCSMETMKNLENSSLNQCHVCEIKSYPELSVPASNSQCHHASSIIFDSDVSSAEISSNVKCYENSCVAESSKKSGTLETKPSVQTANVWAAIPTIMHELFLSPFESKIDKSITCEPSAYEIANGEPSACTSTSSLLEIPQHLDANVRGASSETQEGLSNTQYKFQDQVVNSSPELSNFSESTSTLLTVANKSKQASMGIASITGTVVGGAAGLALAGPAGALIGSKLGQAACILTVLIQGRRVVLIGAGALAAGLTLQKNLAQHGNLTQNKDFHLLSLKAADQSSQESNLMLIRPNIQIDPKWDSVVASATFLFEKSEGVKVKSAENDGDILNATELDTREKVLLLVSRNLNERRCHAGFVYRNLIEFYRRRYVSHYSNRKEEAIDIPCVESDQVRSVPFSGNKCSSNEIMNPQSYSCSAKIELSPTANSENKQTQTDPLNYRGAISDAHAVIIKVAETLLLTQPSLTTSTSLRHMTTEAVEILVLGDLYESIFQEFVAGVLEKDTSLQQKIEMLGNVCCEYVSIAAIESLKLLSFSCSAVEKLECCVEFLERISESFMKEDSSKVSLHQVPIDADSLLSKVCSHIIVAKVPSIHAELAFIEEFAKDEQLLRGKLGYAFVTMQASLYILTYSTDLMEFLQ